MINRMAGGYFAVRVHWLLYFTLKYFYINYFIGDNAWLAPNKSELPIPQPPHALEPNRRR